MTTTTGGITATPAPARSLPVLVALILTTLLALLTPTTATAASTVPTTATVGADRGIPVSTEFSPPGTQEHTATGCVKRFKIGAHYGAMPCNQPGVSLWWGGDKTYEVVVVGTDYRVYHIFQRFDGDKTWSGFRSLQGGKVSPRGGGINSKKLPHQHSVGLRVYGTDGKFYCSNGHIHKWYRWYACTDF
ncbi:hypothetical protein AB0N89_20085 [Amycolatopsis sp. NPDC089917]|uniref:hypothetical protein n=1 Tax=Amycolatopsis sp. NPDC089917 TaxID=3155187 RepID=UPI003423CC1E